MNRNHLMSGAKIIRNQLIALAVIAAAWAIAGMAAYGDGAASTPQLKPASKKTATAPKVVIAKDGKALMPIYFIAHKLAKKDAEQSFETWRGKWWQAGSEFGPLFHCHYSNEQKKAAWPELVLKMDNAIIMQDISDLKRCLDKMTGAKFEVQPLEKFPEKPGPGIYVGAVEDFKWLDMPQDLGFEEIYLRSTANNQVIIAGTQREGMTFDRWITTNASDVGIQRPGISRAVYSFLDKLGCRWFFPAPAWEVIPKSKDITVSLNERHVPSYFLERRLGVGGNLRMGDLPEDFAIWQIRNRMGEPFSPHVEQGGLPEKELAKHPEWFAEVGGKRQATQFCYSNQHVIDEGIQRALSFGESPEYMLSLSPVDGDGYCECKQCRKLAGVPLNSKENYCKRADGKLVSVTSEAFYTYVNKVAEALRKKYPRKMVGTLAYLGTTYPPSFDLQPNVYVEIATKYRGGCPLSLEDQMKEFSKHCKNIGTYYFYSVYQWTGDLPGQATSAHPDWVAYELQTFYRNGVRGLGGEAAYNWGPNGLGYYTAARVMWDIKLNSWDVENDFYKKAFGPAAENIRHIYKRWSMGCPYNNKDIMALSYRDLNDAMTLTAKDPECRARVNQIRMYLHFLHHYITPFETENIDIAKIFGYADKKIAKKALGDLREFNKNIMNTGMIYSGMFNGWSSTLARTLGCPFLAKTNEGDEEVKVAGKIPSVAEMDRLFNEDLKEMKLADFTALKDISCKSFGGPLTPVREAMPKLLTAGAPIPFKSTQTSKEEFKVLAKKGETVKLQFKTSRRGQGATYSISLAGTKFKAGAMQREEQNPKITFRAPQTGVYDINLELFWPPVEFGPMSDCSHPFVTESGDLGTQYYFYVPKGTKHFMALDTAGGNMTIAFKNGQGQTVRALDELTAKERWEPREDVDVRGAAKQERSSAGAFMVDVPAGSDGAIWSFYSTIRTWDGHIKLIGVPCYMSLRPDLLMLPRDALD